jgi:hypothetical protein
LSAVPSIAVVPIIFFGIIALIIVLTILQSSRTVKVKKSRYASPDIPVHLAHVRERYVPGQFSQQMELDMRLPFRRFKKLYPNSNITYEEYKKMQMQSAYRRSMSSQENKRMVR